MLYHLLLSKHPLLESSPKKQISAVLKNMGTSVEYGTQSDQFIVSTITGPQWIMGAVLLCALFFVALKRIFNTWSVFAAYRNLRENDKTRKEYMRLFETRENLLFHIGSAKAHGEFDLARKLLKELDVVDKEIDAMEEKYSYLLK